MQHAAREMLERRAMTKITPLWILLVTAIAVIGAVLINNQLLEQQLRFEALQSELKRASARALELEKHAVRLSFDREDAIRGRFDLLDKLDGAHSTIVELQSRLSQSTSVINDLKNEVVKTRLEIENRQSRLEALQSEVESLTQSLDQAHANIRHTNAEPAALLRELR
jgi:peptidoglycan hydrolase CwlO-like protein